MKLKSTIAAIAVALLLVVFWAQATSTKQSIVLTYTNASGIISEKEFSNKNDVNRILKMISNQTNLSDSDEQLRKRSGGAILIITISEKSKKTEFSVLLAIPKSLNYEVTVILGDNSRTYTDAHTFDQLKKMLT